MNQEKLLNTINYYEDAVLALSEESKKSFFASMHLIMNLRKDFYKSLDNLPEKEQCEMRFLETFKFNSFCGKLLCRNVSNLEYGIILKLMIDSYKNVKTIDKNNFIYNQLQQDLDNALSRSVKFEDKQLNFRINSTLKAKKQLENTVKLEECSK